MVFEDDDDEVPENILERGKKLKYHKGKKKEEKDPFHLIRFYDKHSSWYVCIYFVFTSI